MTPDQLFQLFIAGLTIGSIYALIALGFVVIHNVTGVINLAQGEFAMLGALIAITLTSETPLFNRAFTVSWNLPLVVGIVLATLLVMGVGALVYLIVIRAARTDSVIIQIIITIGIAIALRGIALIIWGTDPYRLPEFSEGPPIHIGGAVLTRQDLWVIGSALALFILLYLFFQRTFIGASLRACSVNRTAARLMGINVPHMMLLAFVLSAGIGALAGIVIAPKTFMGYDTGTYLGLKGFVAAIVIGGLSDERGAIIGGLLLGILEILAAGLISSGYKDAIAFLVLVVVLLVQTTGILRRGTRREAAGV
ncbi:MAG: branched-chain amino acid ABC transporter permease [Anaerolineae bacterium]|nr:branched-chain amino acid ABC transporter permease [Anaerolineae bacterium]